MPEGLSTADGTPLSDIPSVGTEQNDDFAAMMAAQAKAAEVPSGERKMPPPPKKTGDPEAPYGRTADGTPRGKPGRKPKADKPRVESPQSAQKDTAPRDYTRDLADAFEGVWFMLAGIPVTQAQATILKANTPSMVNGLNLAAQKNAYIRSGVEKLSGEITWPVALGMAIAPFALASYKLWVGGDEALAASGIPSKAELAAIAQADLQALAQKNAEMMQAA